MSIFEYVRTVTAGLAVAAMSSVGSANAAQILYFSDLSVGTDRMAQALVAVGGSHTITTAPNLASFTASLGGGGFNLGIFFQQNSSGGLYDSAWTALATHVAGGGAAIGADWSRNDSHASPFGTSFTGNVNQTAVTMTDSNLLAGITNPVDLFSPGWVVFSTGLVPGTCGATFGNGECAIILGNGGRTIFNGFLNDTFVDGAEGT
jgi:hypothetical protein